MLDYPKLRESIRAGNSALWATVDAIQEEAIRTDQGPLADGELERLQNVIAEEGKNFSTSRIQRLDRLGRWLIRGGSAATPITLRSFTVTYSQLAMDAGLVPDETAEKLLSQKKWTTRSFESAIRPEPEPIKHPTPVTSKTTFRVVYKEPEPEPEYTEEYVKNMLRNMMEGASEEVINKIYTNLTTDPKDLRSDWSKFVHDEQIARNYAYKLATMLNGVRTWLKQRQTTLAQRVIFQERWHELTDVTTDVLIVLADGLSDDMIEKALTKFEVGS